MSKSLEPLPCPWYGGPAKIYDPSGGGTWWAIKTECLPKCRAMRGGYPTEAEAIAAWNRRVPATPPPDAELDALCESIALDAKAFREHVVYDSEGDPHKMGAVADRLDTYAAAINSLRIAREAEQAALLKGIRLGLEAAVKKSTSFLVGDPQRDVPLRNPMAHEVADAIRALDPNTIAKDAE